MRLMKDGQNLKNKVTKIVKVIVDRKVGMKWLVPRYDKRNRKDGKGEIRIVLRIVKVLKIKIFFQYVLIIFFVSDAIITSKQASRAAKKSGGDGTSKSSAIAAATTVGRQTNNSLAAATGQIVIQPLAMPHKKKLKTSQV